MYTQLHSWENLLLAFRKAAKGKRGHPNVAAFEYRLEENLLQLRVELENFSYRPGDYVSFYIHEPKRRLISAAPFRDRVVHHALCNLIEPIFERIFIPDTYANRIGKGTHRALDQAQAFSRRFPYVLQCDIRQFFPSIDHEILRNLVARRIRDRKVMWLVERILESGCSIQNEAYQMVYFSGDDLFSIHRHRGLPIGNLTSQFWGNVYLQPFDNFIKRHLGCPAYLRYVDDFMLFGNSKEKLWYWRNIIITKLAERRLIIHEKRAQVYPVETGIPFLGFRIYPTHRRVKRRKVVRFRRKLRSLVDAVHRGEIEFECLDASVQGWVNHVRFGDTWGLRKAVLGMNDRPLFP